MLHDSPALPQLHGAVCESPEQPVPGSSWYLSPVHGGPRQLRAPQQLADRSAQPCPSPPIKPWPVNRDRLCVGRRHADEAVREGRETGRGRVVPGPLAVCSVRAHAAALIHIDSGGRRGTDKGARSGRGRSGGRPVGERPVRRAPARGEAGQEGARSGRSRSGGPCRRRRAVKWACPEQDWTVACSGLGNHRPDMAVGKERMDMRSRYVDC